MNSRKKPVFLNLFIIRFSMAAIMSVIHRISGVVMVLVIPVLLYILQLSLSADKGFNTVAAFFAHPLGLFILFLMLWALMHHLFAGMRYLLIDIDVGVEHPTYRYSAWAVMLVSPLVALILLGGLA